MGFLTSRAGPGELSDTDLVQRSRSGDSDAYAELWRRHSRAGVSVARSYTSTFDADDLVAESYAKIFQAIQAGGGPTGAFRPYLFTTIRNTAASWGRANRETPIEDAELIEDPAFSEENTLAALDRSLTATAFQSLPTRWQEALWYSEVEAMTPQEIAPLLGMKANGVAALTYRAREGLRQAWIQAHLRSLPADSDCRWSIDHLGSYARDGLSKRDTARVDFHLADCARCTIVAAEAKEVSSRLALVLLPLAAGVAGGAGYAAWLQSGAHAAAYALGATGAVMPAAAVSAGAGAASGAGAAGGSTGGAGGGAAGAAAGSSAGAGASGVVIGTVVTGVLVAAGVTAAIALGPTLFGGPSAHKHDAASTPSSSPATEPAPAPSTSPAPVALPPAAPAPAPVANPSGSAPVSAPAADTSSPATPSAPAAPVSPPSSAPPTTPSVPGAPSVSQASVSPEGLLTLAGTGGVGNTVVATAQQAASGGSRGTARFRMLLEDVAVGQTTVGADGNWQISADLVGVLPNGAYTISIVQSSGAGTSVPVSRSIAVNVVEVPVITAVDTGEDGHYFPIVSGTGIPGAQINVTADGNKNALASPVVDSDGAWSTPQLTGLAAGEHVISATQSVDGVASASVDSAQFALNAPDSVTAVQIGWGNSAEGPGPLFTLTVDGAAGAPFSAAADDDRWYFGSLDADGHYFADNWVWNDSTAGEHTISVRYESGSGSDERFGPSISTTILLSDEPR